MYPYPGFQVTEASAAPRASTAWTWPAGPAPAHPSDRSAELLGRLLDPRYRFPVDDYPSLCQWLAFALPGCYSWPAGAHLRWDPFAEPNMPVTPLWLGSPDQQMLRLSPGALLKEGYPLQGLLAQWETPGPTGTPLPPSFTAPPGDLFDALAMAVNQRCAAFTGGFPGQGLVTGMALRRELADRLRTRGGPQMETPPWSPQDPVAAQPPPQGALPRPWECFQAPQRADSLFAGAVEPALPDWMAADAEMLGRELAATIREDLYALSVAPAVPCDARDAMQATDAAQVTEAPEAAAHDATDSDDSTEVTDSSDVTDTTDAPDDAGASEANEATDATAHTAAASISPISQPAPTVDALALAVHTLRQGGWSTALDHLVPTVMVRLPRNHRFFKMGLRVTHEGNEVSYGQRTSSPDEPNLFRLSDGTLQRQWRKEMFDCPPDPNSFLEAAARIPYGMLNAYYPNIRQELAAIIAANPALMRMRLALAERRIPGDHEFLLRLCLINGEVTPAGRQVLDANLPQRAVERADMERWFHLAASALSRTPQAIAEQGISVIQAHFLATPMRPTAAGSRLLGHYRDMSPRVSQRDMKQALMECLPALYYAYRSNYRVVTYLHSSEGRLKSLLSDEYMKYARDVGNAAAQAERLLIPANVGTQYSAT